SDGCRRPTFFFQAEDGIRDFLVTGVQTCALPISARCALAAGDIDPASIDLLLVAALRPDSLIVGDGAFLLRELGIRAPAINFERSEERRVGEECRARRVREL